MIDLTPKKKDRLTIFVIKSMIKRYSQDGVAQMGGQLAYFCILSIFPFFIFINSFIARLNLPLTSWIRGMNDILPPDIINIITSYIDHINKYSDVSIMSIGLLVTIYLASKSAMSLIHAISRAYRTDDCGFFKKIFLSILITIMLGFSIIVSLILITFGKGIIISLLEFLHLPLILASVWEVLRWLIAPLIMMYTLWTVYFITPCRKNTYKEVFPGTLFAIIGFFLMTVLFSIYVNKYANYSGVYGSLGGIIIFMVWLYSSGIIIVMGAELNHSIKEWKSYREEDKNKGTNIDNEENNEKDKLKNRKLKSDEKAESKNDKLKIDDHHKPKKDEASNDQKYESKDDKLKIDDHHKPKKDETTNDKNKIINSNEVNNKNIEPKIDRINDDYKAELDINNKGKSDNTEVSSDKNIDADNDDLCKDSVKPDLEKDNMDGKNYPDTDNRIVEPVKRVEKVKPVDEVEPIKTDIP